MASLREDKRTGKWIVQFRFDRPRQYTKSTGTTDKRKANAKKEEIEETIYFLREGMLTIPDGEDVADWIYTRGKTAGRKRAHSNKLTLGSLTDIWLEHRRLQVNAGQIAHSTYSSDFGRMAKFKEFCGKRHVATDLLGSLEQYQKECLKRLSAGCSPTTTHHELRTVRAMVHWAWKNDKVKDLPKCLSGYACVKLPTPEPEEYTHEEIKLLLAAAPCKVRLYTLLGINCGYTQVDIASLEHDMIDWSSGIINRKRHKTETIQEHKLWPSTKRLLRLCAEKEGNVVLRGKTGRHLVYHYIQQDGTPSKTDAITTAFAKLKKVCSIEGKSFSTLRNTGASAIDEEFQQYPQLVDLYLAHSEKKMKKHYTPKHYQLLHEATDWLGSKFGIAE